MLIEHALMRNNHLNQINLMKVVEAHEIEAEIPSEHQKNKLINRWILIAIVSIYNTCIDAYGVTYYSYIS